MVMDMDPPAIQIEQHEIAKLAGNGRDGGGSTERAMRRTGFYASLRQLYDAERR